MAKMMTKNEFEKKSKGLMGLINNTTDIISLLIDWKKGTYEVAPIRSIIAMIVGGLYFFSPIDFIPDFIPFLGVLDDAVILSFVIKQFTNDLIPYRQWKSER